MAGEKILITGARGNLGQQLIKVFSDVYNVTAYDKSDVDITNHGAVTKMFDSLQPDIIINAAAYNNVDECENHEGYERAKRLNVDAVSYLAESAVKHASLFINYSTDYVFDGSKQKGYNEDDTPNPINKYGETKYDGEKVIQKYSDLQHYIIRTSKLFGPKGTSQKSKPSFFDTMLNLSETKTSLDVVNEEVSKFTYTQDLANTTKELIEQKQPYGIYHIANSDACTWYEAARELFKQKNISITLNGVSSDIFPRPAKRPKHSELLMTKLNPLRSWKEALHDYLVSN